MKLLLLSFLMFVSDAQMTSENNIFIYEYHPKIKGQAIIGFVFTDSTSSQVVDTSYKITYNDNGVKNVIRNSEKYQRKITENNIGIFIENTRLTCYHSESFERHTKYSKDFYKLLNKDFLVMKNNQRYEILEDLFKTISSK